MRDVFDEIYRSYAHVKSDLTFFENNKNDRVPFISRTDQNNGVDCFVPLCEVESVEKENAITIGDTNSTIYYQPDDFVTGDHIVICRGDRINRYTALFINGGLEKERYKYSYGRAFKMSLVKETKIKLPQKFKNGRYVPDWEFMDSYIKALPHGDKV